MDSSLKAEGRRGKMNRSGALKLTAIVVVLVLCVSSAYIGLQLASKGTNSVSSDDASPVLPDQPMSTGESPSNTAPSSGDSNVLQPMSTGESPSNTAPSSGDSNVLQPVTNENLDGTTTEPIIVGPV